MLKNTARYGRDTKKLQLSCKLFYKDDPSQMYLTVIEENDGILLNEGGMLVHRRHVIQSCTFNMVGHIHAAIFFQDHYLLNNVGLKFRLIRSKDRFASWVLP